VYNVFSKLDIFLFCFLQSHMRMHSGQRPFDCTVCGKSFSQESNLKTHMIIHTGQRPHRCDQCPKAFKQVGQLPLFVMHSDKWLTLSLSMSQLCDT
jgi:uncharacterized Zn-finger protein